MSGLFTFKSLNSHQPLRARTQTGETREKSRTAAVAGARRKSPSKKASEAPFADLESHWLTQWAPPLIIAASVLMLFLLPMMKSKARRPAATPIQNSNKVNPTLHSLNRDIQGAYQKAELESLRIKNENSELAPTIQESDVRPWAQGQDHDGVDLRQDQRVNQIYEDISRPRGPQHQTYEDRVDSVLATRQWMSDYDRHLRDKYVQEVVARARQAGYELKINDRLEVVAVREVGVPQRAYRGPQSLPPTGTGDPAAAQ